MDRVQFRRDTAENWQKYNPVLMEGEMGLVTDNPNQYKMGDGTNNWNDLPLRGYTGTIAQDTGDDENAVMSQKAVTEELTELSRKTINYQIYKSTVNIQKDEILTPTNTFADSIINASGEIISDGGLGYSVIQYNVTNGVFCIENIRSGAEYIAIAFYDTDKLIDSISFNIIATRSFYFDVTGHNINKILLLKNNNEETALYTAIIKKGIKYEDDFKTLQNELSVLQKKGGNKSISLGSIYFLDEELVENELIENKYLSTKGTFITNDDYNIKCFDVTGIDIIHIENVRSGNISSALVAKDNNDNIIDVVYFKTLDTRDIDYVIPYNCNKIFVQYLKIDTLIVRNAYYRHKKLFTVNNNVVYLNLHKKVKLQPSKIIENKYIDTNGFYKDFSGYNINIYSVSECNYVAIENTRSGKISALCIFRGYSGDIIDMTKYNTVENRTIILRVPQDASILEVTNNPSLDTSSVYIMEYTSGFRGLLKMASLGDSITWGYKPLTGTPQLDSYAKLTANDLKLQLVNLGINGSTLGAVSEDTEERNPMVYRYNDIPEDSDIITIMGGTNDVRYECCRNKSHMGTIYI